MYYCIVNPKARSGKGKEIWDKLEYKFLEKGLDYEVHLTKGPAHATRIAARLTTDPSYAGELPIRIVVLGGDGTLNEVINGISDFDRVLLGYVPIGSANDFARDLSYPGRVENLIDTIIKGQEVRCLDLGRLTFNTADGHLPVRDGGEEIRTRLFDVSSGIGFDAAVCEEAIFSGTKSFFNKIGLGKLTYGTIALRQLLKAEKVPCDMEFDNGDRIHLDRFIFIAAMIHHYEGGGFNFAPNADLTDGRFDLVYAGNMPAARMLFALPFSFFGNYYWIKGIGHNTVSKVTIRTGKPMWVHTDGEVSVRSDNITLECLKQRLRLMN